ncbi:peptidoglycan-binding protein [Bacillus wiedmannii]|uniref:peptidoglycan-binding protein n=1 Tax=Bacillus wiedmannii TaxID=1890302 RepID=UPI00272FFEC5|nr:peptidoglycan-binding protein [Bacillus wiedmannii]MDP1460112.1 peptidoglycan-binding protein [Bacillus wiedmannii]
MATLPTIQFGSTGHYVKLLQLNLNGLGISYDKLLLNSIFDEQTLNITKRFQGRLGLPQKGIVDHITWKFLIESVKEIQKNLHLKRIYSASIDGIFGPLTTQSVQKFQETQNLYPSGDISPRTRLKLFNPHSQYDILPSSNNLNALNPYVEVLAKKLLDLTQTNGLNVRVTSTFRSWDEQDRLFSQGRWQPGQIVTNARGGESYHNWGVAFDVAPYKDNIITWDDTSTFIEIGYLGARLGLKWGGTFTSLVDYPHFEYSFSLSTWNLLTGISFP